MLSLLTRGLRLAMRLATQLVHVNLILLGCAGLMSAGMAAGPGRALAACLIVALAWGPLTKLAQAALCLGGAAGPLPAVGLYLAKPFILAYLLERSLGVRLSTRSASLALPLQLAKAAFIYRFGISRPLLGRDAAKGAWWEEVTRRNLLACDMPSLTSSRYSGSLSTTAIPDHMVASGICNLIVDSKDVWSEAGSSGSSLHQSVGEMLLRDYTRWVPLSLGVVLYVPSGKNSGLSALNLKLLQSRSARMAVLSTYSLDYLYWASILLGALSVILVFLLAF